jgi:hypothetical protein
MGFSLPPTIINQKESNMTETPATPFRELLQTILENVSDEERDEIALEVERIGHQFARLGDLLSCLTKDDRVLFLNAFGMTVGSSLIFRACQNEQGDPSRSKTAHIDFLDAIIGVASLTTSLEDHCVRVFAQNYGMNACQRYMEISRTRMAERIEAAERNRTAKLKS